MEKKEKKISQTYHVYNRGVERRSLFLTREDYDRFRAYLYIFNDEDSPRAANLLRPGSAESPYAHARNSQLVAIGGYCLLPHAFHIIATPLMDGGLSKFMQKISTAYTMFFNERTVREGRLFQGSYKKIPLNNKDDLRFHLSYIHLAPMHFFNKDWDEASFDELAEHEHKISSYPYSSARDYAKDDFTILSKAEYFKRAARHKNMKDALKYWVDTKDRYTRELSRLK